MVFPRRSHCFDCLFLFSSFLFYLFSLAHCFFLCSVILLFRACLTNLSHSSSILQRSSVMDPALLFVVVFFGLHPAYWEPTHVLCPRPLPEPRGILT